MSVLADSPVLVRVRQALVYVVASFVVLAHALVIVVTDADVSVALLTAEVILAGSTVALLRLHRADDPLRAILVAGLFAKMASSLGFFFVVAKFYGGSSDAVLYDRSGRRLALSFVQGQWVAPNGRIPGTGFIEVLTGGFYSLASPSILAAYFFMAGLAYWGQYLFVRAFVMSAPRALHRRYAGLVMFLPSMLLWPSSLGKDAWMVFALGVAVYGAAGMYRRRSGALLWLALGLAGACLVRPHVALLTAAAALAGYSVKSNRLARGGGLGKSLGLVALIAVVGAVLVQVQGFLALDELNSSSVGDVLDDTSRRTERGTSVYVTGGPVGGVVGLPLRLVTVLFRPFPYEADNVLALMVSLEGLVLLILTAIALRRALGRGRRVLKQPLVVLAGTYVLLFSYGFSSFSNFGILSRQRVQVLPLLFMVLVPLLSRSVEVPDDQASTGLEPADGPGQAVAQRRGSDVREQRTD